MGKEPTAERQLLDLIEQQDNKAAKNDSLQKEHAFANVLTTRKPPFFAPSVIKARIEFFVEQIKNSKTGAKKSELDFSMDVINNLLILIIVGMFVFLAYEIMAKPYKFQKIPDLTSNDKVEVIQSQTKKEQKDIDFYLEKLNNRDIFSLKPIVEEPKEVEEVVEQSQIELIVDDLKLVGLSPATDYGNSFIMVESQEDEVTIFLEEGDDLKGITLKKILSDKVLFTDGTEERELR